MDELTASDAFFLLECPSIIT